MRKRIASAETKDFDHMKPADGLRIRGEQLLRLQPGELKTASTGFGGIFAFS